MLNKPCWCQTLTTNLSVGCHQLCQYGLLITVWVRARLCKLQKRCTRLAAANDKAYQLLANGRWFSPGTPASSTTKTSRYDTAEILLIAEDLEGKT